MRGRRSRERAHLGPEREAVQARVVLVEDLGELARFGLQVESIIVSSRSKAESGLKSERGERTVSLRPARLDGGGRSPCRFHTPSRPNGDSSCCCSGSSGSGECVTRSGRPGSTAPGSGFIEPLEPVLPFLRSCSCSFSSCCTRLVMRVASSRIDFLRCPACRAGAASG